MRSVADDAALLARLRAHEADAFEALVRTHGGRLLAVVRRLLRHEEDAREAVQETFVQAFRSIDGFAGEAQLATWLHRIAVNTALMRLRSRRRKPEESIDDLLPRFDEDGAHADHYAEWRASAETLAARHETRALVRASIDRLPESYRTVLLLRDIEERDTEDTAEQLGVSVDAVKSRLHRARMALRAMLDHHIRGGEA